MDGLKEEKLVWYASYGSNAFRDRFYCYIRGGMIEGNTREYLGCGDPSLPLDEKNILITHRLYFAKKSKSWSQGGVGFIEHEKTTSDRTYGRMYLITESQFADVVKQETRSTENVVIDFEATAQNGQLHILDKVWYGKLLYLGTERGYPIFTFTHETDVRVYNAPSPEYLKTLIKGLKVNYGLSAAEVAQYLIGKPGISGNYDGDNIEKLYAEAKDELSLTGQLK